MPPVDDTERGQAIRRRRMALGIRSVSELAVRSGVSRSATSAAEHGRGARGTYERLEAWLSERERENGHEEPAVVRPLGEGGFTEVTLFKGAVRAVVKAPVDNPEALREAIANVLAAIPDEDGEDPESSPENQPA